MARRRTETATETSKETKTIRKFSRPKKCMKTSTKKLHEPGKHNSRREDKSSPSKCSEESPSSQVQKSIITKDGAQEVPVLDIHSCKEVRVSGKMKLQLFPLDAHTREGLEKDGFHPYLELTLSSRKKVSSVLQHIHTKWGSSEIARGDHHPTLYPYDKSVLTSGHKWTSNSNITISDVYMAIGSPYLFRLRYGWSSETCNKTDEPLSPSTPSITCFPSEEPENNTESPGFRGKQMFGLDNQFTVPSSSNQVTDQPNTRPVGQVESAENKINDGSGPTFFSWDDGLTSLSIGGLLSEASLKGNLGNHCKNSNATLWVDNLTNISIGGLFSEASLQDINRELVSARNHNNNDQPSVSIGASDLSRNKTWETRRDISQQQQLPLISDSLDAFLVNQTDQSRAPCPAPPHSSILDAEDTCHAFSFRKPTTTSDKESEEAEEKQQKDESKPSKGLFNQDSSLGFSGIKWADSRGPFDFGLSSSSRKFTNGDSVSFFGAVLKDL